MDDLISRQALMKEFSDFVRASNSSDFAQTPTWNDAVSLVGSMPSAQPEIIRCHQCGFWDRDTLQHNFNDFRDWNEAECLLLAERDGYHEINRYTEADDFCSRAERRNDG